MRKIKFITKSTTSGNEVFSMNIFDGNSRFAVHVIVDGDNVRTKAHIIGDSCHNNNFSNINDAMRHHCHIGEFINDVEKLKTIVPDKEIDEKLGNNNITRYNSDIAEFVSEIKKKSEEILKKSKKSEKDRTTHDDSIIPHLYGMSYLNSIEKKKEHADIKDIMEFFSPGNLYIFKEHAFKVSKLINTIEGIYKYYQTSNCKTLNILILSHPINFDRFSDMSKDMISSDNLNVDIKSVCYSGTETLNVDIKEEIFRHCSEFKKGALDYIFIDDICSCIKSISLEVRSLMDALKTISTSLNVPIVTVQQISIYDEPRIECL